VPPLAGVVERGAGEGTNAHEVLLRLDEPAPGVALVGAYTWGGQTYVMVSLYLFGDRAHAVASRDEPLWHAWMNELFTPAEVASKEAS
jgi:hypothetical protein